MRNFKRQLRAALLFVAVTFTQGELSYRKRRRDDGGSRTKNRDTYESARRSMNTYDKASRSVNTYDSASRHTQHDSASRSMNTQHHESERRSMNTYQNSRRSMNTNEGDTHRMNTHESARGSRKSQSANVEHTQSSARGSRNSQSRYNQSTKQSSARGSRKSQSSGHVENTQYSATGSSNDESEHHQMFESSRRSMTKYSALKATKLSATTKEGSSHKASYDSATSYVSESYHRSHDDGSHHDDSGASKSEWHESHDPTRSEPRSNKPQMMKRSKHRGTYSKRSKSRAMMSMIHSEHQDIFTSEDIFFSEDEAYLSYPPAPSPGPTSTTRPTLSPVLPPTDAPITSTTSNPTFSSPTTPTITSPTTPTITSPTTPTVTAPTTPTVGMPTTPTVTMPTTPTVSGTTSPTITEPITPRPTLMTPRPTPGTPRPTLPRPSMGNNEEYNIDLAFATNMPTMLRGEFRKAADRIEEIIVGDLPERRGFTIPPEYRCPERPTYVDDMWICAQYGVLPEFVEAEGGFSRVRMDGTSLPYVGYVEISERVPNPPYEIILHEMLQAVGFGTLWPEKELVDSEEPPCMYSKTSNATSEFLSVSGCGGTVGVPIDQLECSHWDETCLVNELMTSTLPGDLAIDAPISTITIGSLQDLGYEVDYSAADEYTARDMDPSCTCTASVESRHNKLHKKGGPRGTGGRNHQGRFRHQEDERERAPTIPPMSQELKEKATEYGKNILRQRKELRRQRHQERERRDLLGHPDLLKKKRRKHFKKDKDAMQEEEESGIFLLVRENGWRYSIVVNE